MEIPNLEDTNINAYTVFIKRTTRAWMLFVCSLICIANERRITSTEEVHNVGRGCVCLNKFSLNIFTN